MGIREWGNAVAISLPFPSPILIAPIAPISPTSLRSAGNGSSAVPYWMTLLFPDK